MLKLPSCPEVQDHLTDYLEGSLPAGKRLGFWIHLALCKACRGLLGMLRVLPAFGKQALEAPEKAPAEAEAALRSALAKIKDQTNH